MNLKSKPKYVDTQLNNSIQGLTLYGKDDIPATILRLEKAREKLGELLK